MYCSGCFLHWMSWSWSLVQTQEITRLSFLSWLVCMGWNIGFTPEVWLSLRQSYLFILSLFIGFIDFIGWLWVVTCLGWESERVVWSRRGLWVQWTWEWCDQISWILQLTPKLHLQYRSISAAIGLIKDLKLSPILQCSNCSIPLSSGSS